MREGLVHNLSPPPTLRHPLHAGTSELLGRRGTCPAGEEGGHGWSSGGGRERHQPFLTGHPPRSWPDHSSWCPPHLPHTDGSTFDGWGWVGTKGAGELGACPHGHVSVQWAMAPLLVRMICWTEDVAQCLECLSSIRACLRPSWKWLMTFCLP